MSMSNYKKYIQKQFQNLKSTATGLISPENKKENEQHFIELDTAMYDKLKEIADSEQITVESVFNHAIELYISKYKKQFRSQMTLEQKENNPVLYLNNLSKKIN